MIGGFKLPLYDNLVSGILARLWGCDLRPLLWLKMESLTFQTKYISMLKLHSFQWSLITTTLSLENSMKIINFFLESFP